MPTKWLARSYPGRSIRRHHGAGNHPVASLQRRRSEPSTKMIPAATTAKSNMLCPKSRPAELETTLPCAATGDGTPDGGAPVPPPRDDESEARSSLVLCPCTADHPCGEDSVVVDTPALGPGGGDAPD